MNHKVLQGEHVFGLAERYGFQNYHTVWDHQSNADLKKIRNPNVLFPGDQLFIPAKQVGEEACQTGRLHVFRLERKPLKLRIALRDFDNQPIRGAACQLAAGGKNYDLVSSQDGMIEQLIPGTLKTATLRVPKVELVIEVKVGDLDPIEKETGWMARLTNLGYLEPYIESDSKNVSFAVQEFQCDYKLKVTGSMDGTTLAMLLSVYGS